MSVTVIATALLLAACSSDTHAHRNSPSALHVVPVTGTAAGGGYGYWQQRFWQLVLSQPSVPACATATGPDSQTVGLLNGGQLGVVNATCTEPAGRAVYVAVNSVECSTFAGNHGLFGPGKGTQTLTSVAQLPACARQAWSGTTFSATVDGKTVDLSALLAASQVFPIDVITNNAFGFNAQGQGRSASYGSGLLLTGLSAGTHLIHTLAAYPPQKQSWDYTFTVHVT